MLLYGDTEEGGFLTDATDADASTPQESDLSEDEIWDSVPAAGDEDSGGVDVPTPTSDTLDATDEEEPEESYEEGAGESEVAEQPEHDWEKRYKDIEKDYHKKNQDNAEFRRGSDSKVNELEKQLQALQIERLENREQLSRLNKSEKENPEEVAENTLDSLLSDEDKRTMSDFSEVMSVVNKIVDHKMKGSKSATAPASAPSEEIEEIKKSLQEMQYHRFLEYYDKEMRSQVGDDYLEIAEHEKFNEFWQNEPGLKDAVESSQDPKRHAWVAEMWLNTDEGRSYRAAKEGPPKQASGKRKQKREVAQGLVKNTQPPKEASTSSMNEDELWDHIMKED